MILTDTPGRAFDKVALDIVGPFHRTVRGHAYVPTIQDLLTPFTFLCWTLPPKLQQLDLLTVSYAGLAALKVYLLIKAETSQVT